MSAPIIAADLRLRRRVLLSIVLMVVMGGLVLWRLDAYLDALVILKKTDPHGVAQHVSRLLLLLAACTALLTVSLAGVLSYMALQVLSSGQYPPPGMRVIRDTQLRTGSRATALAQVGLVLAAAVLLCGLGASVVLMRVSQDFRLPYPGPIQEAAGGARLSGSLPPLA